MTDGMVATQRRGSSGRNRSSPDAFAGGPLHAPGWVPAALGTVAVLAALGSHRKGVAALALTAIAGATVMGTMRGGRPDHGRIGENGENIVSGGEPEVERSVTIGKTVDELYQLWLDVGTLPQIMAGFATVQANGRGRVHWKMEGPLGRIYEWDSETADDRPGESIAWRSLSNAAISNAGSVRFHRAPADRGSVVTMHLRFDPPGGPLGDAAVKHLGIKALGLAIDGVLRRFKSLAETGEIPTTERQPAARSNTR